MSLDVGVPLLSYDVVFLMVWHEIWCHTSWSASIRPPARHDVCCAPSQAGAAISVSDVTQRPSIGLLQHTSAHVHDRPRIDGRHVGGTD